MPVPNVTQITTSWEQIENKSANELRGKKERKKTSAGMQESVILLLIVRIQHMKKR